MKFKNENDVNYFVKEKLDSLGLKKGLNYNDENNMSDYLKKALEGLSKTDKKTSNGRPDFHLEEYFDNNEKHNKIPILIENKLGLKYHIADTKQGIKNDDTSIKNYAVNGVIHYATGIIKKKAYKEVIAIGISGDSKDNIKVSAYYVFGSNFNNVKLVEEYTTLDFLENQQAFSNFYSDATLSEKEKHDILIQSQEQLQKYAKKLNKLMHNHNITAPQRVLYVSGMLLSMQDIYDENTNEILHAGLRVNELEGRAINSNSRDGLKIVNRIDDYLKMKGINEEKKNLMLSSFSEISKDNQRDEATELDKEVSIFLDRNASINKQVFTFIYEYIFKSIDSMAGYIDIMGEMYSEFLKYALGDGKEIGIVLTPPYVTKMMAEILKVDKESRVMDLATGSAGFLISAMELMIKDAERNGRDTKIAKDKIKDIKKNQLLGVELNAEMYTLAATNMILRGDGSSNIRKGNTFSTPKELYENFKATKLLLNPPFSYTENGMPFIAFGLDNMEKNGLGAIIIQDSAGSGKAISTNQKILKKHTLLASIKMPVDLFMPMAGVQTSIYVFKAHEPHDYTENVLFIDFRNDGYKRTKRGILELDMPSERYIDILNIYKNRDHAKDLKAEWDLKEVVVLDTITDKGNDWNFEQHKKIDIKPTEDDFRKTVADYMSWEIDTLLKGINTEKK